MEIFSNISEKEPQAAFVGLTTYLDHKGECITQITYRPEDMFTPLDCAFDNYFKP